jgi:chemotaxis protein histidine kinase CheA
MPKSTNPEVRIFFANTRFEKMARRPGGVPREQALAQAQAKIDELKSGFSVWLDRELQELNASLSKVESDPSNKLSLEGAFRNCSELQDIGAAMGYELVTYIAENLCKIIAAIKTGAAYDKDMIECHINALLLAKTDQYRDLSPEQVPEMASGLRRVVELASKTSDHANK